MFYKFKDLIAMSCFGFFKNPVWCPPRQQWRYCQNSGFNFWDCKLASKQQEISDNYRYNYTKLLGKTGHNQFIGH